MTRTDLSKLMKEAHQLANDYGLSMSEALKKAWINLKLLVKMQKGIVKFYFRKVNGELREAYGTLCEKYLPEIKRSDRKHNDTVQVYFDTERQEFRCFKKLNLVNVA